MQKVIQLCFYLQGSWVLRYVAWACCFTLISYNRGYHAENAFLISLFLQVAQRRQRAAQRTQRFASQLRQA